MLVFKRGTVLFCAGIVIGTALGWSVLHLIRGLLFGIKGLDLVAFVAIPLFLAAAAAVSVWMPARRAAKTDPMVVLRSE